jgi:hypothetical protein
MGNRVHVASSLTTKHVNSITTIKFNYILYFSATMIRRKKMWIIFGIIASIVIITTIVVPISILTTSGKINSTTKGR